jgi:hypothetical protein
MTGSSEGGDQEILRLLWKPKARIALTSVHKFVAISAPLIMLDVCCGKCEKTGNYDYLPVITES